MLLSSSAVPVRLMTGGARSAVVPIETQPAEAGRVDTVLVAIFRAGSNPGPPISSCKNCSPRNTPDYRRCRSPGSGCCSPGSWCRSFYRPSRPRRRLRCGIAAGCKGDTEGAGLGQIVEKGPAFGGALKSCQSCVCRRPCVGSRQLGGSARSAEILMAALAAFADLGRYGIDAFAVDRRC
jgi:hypothetical protein